MAVGKAVGHAGDGDAFHIDAARCAAGGGHLLDGGGSIFGVFLGEQEFGQHGAQQDLAEDLRRDAEGDVVCAGDGCGSFLAVSAFVVVGNQQDPEQPQGFFGGALMGDAVHLQLFKLGEGAILARFDVKPQGEGDGRHLVKYSP